MNPTEFTSSQLLDIWREDCEERYVLVEDAEWEDEGKFSSAEIIFEDTVTAKFYSFYVYRSGSYFSHYEYEVWDKAVEVTKVTKTKIVEEWVAV